MKNYRWQDEYDYPMSWTFWQDACRQHGYDPGSNVAESSNDRTPAFDAENSGLNPDSASHLQQQVDHLRAQMLFNQNKVNEHIDISKKMAKKKGDRL